MKIICAGYWKTGTKSLARALRILGYEVYDYDDQCFELGDLWDKFFNGTVTDDEIYSSLKDIDVLIDGPVIAFWEEIHRVFPDATIILTTRDEDSWYKSYQGMHDCVPPKLLLQFILAMFIPSGFRFNRLIASLLRFCQGIEGVLSLGISDIPRLYKLKFRKHNSYVLDRAAKDKLLIHHFKDGWGPLCNFLGHEIPDQDYPNTNKAGSLPVLGERVNPKLKKLMKQTERLLICLVVLIAVAVYWILSGIFQ